MSTPLLLCHSSFRIVRTNLQCLSCRCAGTAERCREHIFRSTAASPITLASSEVVKIT